MFCARCGTKNPDNSVNCYNCGQNMGKVPDRTLQARSGTLAEIRPLAPPQEYGRVDINGSILLVTEREISYRGQSIQKDAVTGIRFGIYKHYFNGIRTSQSYGIWICDESRLLRVECATGFLVPSSEIEHRYQEALKALWPAVMVPLVSRLLEALDDGRGFSIGGVTFNKSGMHRAGEMGALAKGAAGLWSSLAGGKSVQELERDYKHLSWQDYGGHNTASGKVNLFRDKKSWASFSLRDTWNAVCLDPLFTFLCEDGRLWKFVDGKRA